MELLINFFGFVAYHSLHCSPLQYQTAVKQRVKNIILLHLLCPLHGLVDCVQLWSWVRHGLDALLVLIPLSWELHCKYLKKKKNVNVVVLVLIIS